MIFRIILLAVSLAWLMPAEGQVKRKIKKGRRNRSEAQLVPDPGGFQVAWELGHEDINDSLSTFVHPNLVLRYGLRQGTDLSIEINSVTTRESGSQSVKYTPGIEPLLLGVDHVFLKETEHGPSLVGSLQLALPFAASNSYKASHLGPNIQLSAGRTFRHADVASVTGGLFWDGFSSLPIYTYGFDYVLQFNKLAASGSWFGFLGSGPSQHYLDVSLYWQPADLIQFGLTGGIGLNRAAHRDYISVSGQIGFGRKKTKQITHPG